MFRVSSRGLHSSLSSLQSPTILIDCYRYPTEIDFNCRLKKWKCPFCEDICNCTKCCSRRNVSYNSTATIRIDQDTLLHHARLMPDNSNSTKRSLPPSRPSNPSKKSKLAGKSTSKLARASAKAKPDVENDRTSSQTAALNQAATRDIESVIRGLADTAAMFEKLGCVSGDYWGVVFSNIDGGRIGVAYVGDNLPDLFFLRDDDGGGRADEPPPPSTKRLRTSSRISA